MKTWLKHLVIVLVAAVTFSLGIALGGLLLALLGLDAPDMPTGVTAEMAFASVLTGSFVLAPFVLWLARGLPGDFGRRWLLLGLLVYGGHAAMMVEASIFTANSSVLYSILMYLLPSLLMVAVIAWLVPPFQATADPSQAPATRSGWLWRIMVALAAYPVIYVVLGLVIVPYIYDVWHAGMYGLQIPTWREIIVVQLLRSAILLGAMLPVLMSFQQSRIQLYLRLGLALSVLIGLEWTLAGFWMDPALRVVHSLETFADAMLYTAVLMVLFTRRQVFYFSKPTPESGEQTGAVST